MAKRKQSRPRRFWRRLCRLGAGVAALYGLSVGAIAYGFLHPWKRAPRAIPADLGLPAQEVTPITADSKRLSAWWLSQPAGRGAVILGHGHAENRDQTLPQAEFLYAAGYSVLSLDFRGHGASEASACSFGLRERQDIAAAAAWIRRQPGREAEPLAALGLSMGAAAITLARAEGAPLQALILDSCYANLGEVIPNHFWALPPLLRPLYERPVVALAERSLGARVGDLDVAQALARSGETPTLILQGERDRAAPPSEGRELLAAARHGELWIVPGGEHTQLYAADSRGYERRVRAFLAAAFKAPASG